MNDEWAMDQAKRDKASRAALAPGATPQWYVNSQGQTFVTMGPVEFVMGSPPTEADRRPDEVQHRKRIGRTFALAATAVTKEQFLRYRPTFSHTEMRRYPEPTCPIGGVVWYEAAGYCNWLSQVEGIPEEQWCYETNARKLSQEKVSGLVSLLAPQQPLATAAHARFCSILLNRQPQVTALKKGYLGLRGYRLPTEAEVEYATRAGAVTSRCYGETEELLEQYGWYLKNSKERTWPVGSKKPNDLGLFDLHGNVYTWCQEPYKQYPEGKNNLPVDDIEDIVNINTQDTRVLRGGSFTDRASDVRCAYRPWVVPTYRYNTVGFRPARTFR